MIRFLLSKPFLASLLAVSAIGLTAAGHQIQQDALRPEVITKVITKITKVPTKTIIKHQTIVKVPKGSKVIVPRGSSVTGPGASSPPGSSGILPGFPTPPVTLPPVPTPRPTLPSPRPTLPTPTPTLPLPTPTLPTPTPLPTRACIHPPGHKCRHIPHVGLS